MKVKDILDDVFENATGEVTVDLPDLEIDDAALNRNPFAAIGVEVSDDLMVDLVKDGNVLMTKSWLDTQNWVNKNFDSLDGTYIVAHAGAVLHQFTITS